MVSAADLERSQASDNSALQLEDAYQNLQNSLIQLRQAVAQAIATEKHLELTVHKNRDQAATWAERARIAEKQNNLELHNQALSRGRQYDEAASAISTQLLAQTETVKELRKRLTEIEADVQKAYTKKQVLIAREKAADATIKANEILSKFSTEEMTKAISKAESRVAESERRVAESQTSVTDSDGESSIDKTEMNFDSNLALTEAVQALNRLERKLTEVLNASRKQSDLKDKEQPVG